MPNRKKKQRTVLYTLFGPSHKNAEISVGGITLAYWEPVQSSSYEEPAEGSARDLRWRQGNITISSPNDDAVFCVHPENIGAIISALAILSEVHKKSVADSKDGKFLGFTYDAISEEDL